MNDVIYTLMIDAITSLGVEWIFIIALSLEFLLFLVAFCLAIFKTLYTIKKRAWFFVASLSPLFLELALLSLASALELFYLSLAIISIFYLIVLVVPAKKLKITNSQRNLARFIDEQVKAQTESPVISCQKQRVDLEKERVLEKNQDDLDVSRFELDFEHVKSVMQKLEYYPLSTSDKKLMRELEDAIDKAQVLGFSSQIKNKINDGLGALLKIMSKYGI